MKGLLLFLILFISVNSYAQSKKEQIAILNYKIDSLNKEYIKDTVILSNANQLMDRRFDLLSNKMTSARVEMASKSEMIESKLNTIESLETKNLQLAKALRDLEARQIELLANKNELELEIGRLLMGENSSEYYGATEEVAIEEENIDEPAPPVVTPPPPPPITEEEGEEAEVEEAPEAEAEAPAAAPAKVEEIIEFPSVDAAFPGGPAAMMKWINDNLYYPETSIEMNEQGRVFLSFVVEKDGSLTNVAIERGVSSDLDREAMRIVRKMPKWIPGEESGKKCRARCRLPINFQLN